MCDEYMKDTVSECVNECVNECERGCGLEDDNGHQNWGEGAICNKNDIVRAMHRL